jgi:RNA-directed DNA polymerase
MRLFRVPEGTDRPCSLGSAQAAVRLWRQWKTPRRRRAALLQLGVRPRLAANTVGSGRGPWYLARSKALSVGASNAYFRSLGLPSLFENY